MFGLTPAMTLMLPLWHAWRLGVPLQSIIRQFWTLPKPVSLGRMASQTMSGQWLMQA
jgi:hypothetical protein